MIINLPKLGNVKFRDDLSDEEFRSQVSALAKKYDFEKELRPDYGPIEGFTRGVSRGFQRLGSTFGDVLPAMVGSAVGADEYAKRQMEEARQTEEDIQRANPPEFESFKQVEDVGTAVGFLGETVGEQVANLLSVIGPGVGGRVVGGFATKAAARKYALDKGAKAEAAERFADIAAKSGKATGQNVGLFLGSYSLNAPEVFQNIYEETGKLEPAVAGLFSIGSAVLDSILPASILKSITGPQKIGIVEAILRKSGMDVGIARKTSANLIAGLGAEGLTEGAQEAISISAENFVANNPQIFDSKDFDRIMESAVRGAVAGGTFKGVTGIPQGISEKRAVKEGTEEFLAQQEIEKENEAERANRKFERDILNLNLEETDPLERQKRAEEISQTFNKEYLDKIDEINETVANQEAVIEQQKVKDELNQKLKTVEGVDDIIANMDTYFGDYSKAQRNTIREDLKRYKSGTGKYKGAGLRDNVQKEYEDVFADIEPTSPDILTSQKLKEDFGLSIQEAKTKSERDLINSIKDKSIGNPVVRQKLQAVVDSGAASFAGTAQERVVNAAEKILNQKNIQLTLSETATPKARVVKPEVNTSFTSPTSNEQITIPKGIISSYNGLRKEQEKLKAIELSEGIESRNYERQLAGVNKLEELQIRKYASLIKKGVVKADQAEGDALESKLEEIYQQEQQNETITRSNSEGVDPTGESRPSFDDTQGIGGTQRARVADTTRDVVQDTSGARRSDNTLTPTEEVQGDLFPIQKQAAQRMETLPRQTIRQAQQQAITEPQTVQELTQQLIANMNSMVGPVQPSEVQLVNNKPSITLDSITRQTPEPNAGPNSAQAIVNDALENSTNNVEGITSFATESAKPGANQRIINAVSDAIKKKPVADKAYLEKVLNATSALSPKIKTFIQGLMSLPNKVELYGQRLPALQKILDLIQNREAMHDGLFSEVDLLANKGIKLIKKYDKNIRDKFNKTTLELSRLNIDPRKEANANVPLVKQFKSLPQDLQKLAIEYTKKYEEYGDRMFDILSSLAPAVGAQLRLKFEQNRVAFYHPLRRQGDYWLYYLDKNGETVAIARNSARELEQEKQFAIQSGIDPSTIRTATKITDLNVRQAPPAGFMGDIIKLMQKEGIPDSVQDQAYQLYLSLFPTQSLRQQFKGRKGDEGTGIKGYTEDIVQAFAEVGSRMARQLANLNYRPRVDEAYSELMQQYEQQGSPQDLAPTVRDMLDQKSFVDNPVANNVANFLAKVSYFWYIGGNVSSALVNITQLPMTVYPMLGGEYGFDKATKAMMDAQREYNKGGLDRNRSFWPDYSYGVNATGELKQLYDAALKSSAIRRGVGYELTEMRRKSAEDFTGLGSKVSTALSWIFQNSERYNREITLIAAFKLARGKGLSVEESINKAIDLTIRSHSHALPEAGPRLFQDSWGKTFFTFKRFAQAQIYNVANLARLALQNADPETRRIAMRQLAGIMAMTWATAGVVGLPAYGAVNLVVTALHAMLSDDDELFDFEDVTQQSLGTLVTRGGINYLSGFDIASRTGFGGMIWREDPRRLQEVGMMSYAFERLFGPAFQIGVNAQRAMTNFERGEIQRGIENVMPLFIRNISKGLRFATEGALNKDGVPLKEDFNGLESFMQILGFTDTELSEKYQRNNALKKAERRILDRRRSLIDTLYLARTQNDPDGYDAIMRKISKFNAAYPVQGVMITPSTIKKSFKGKDRRIKESTDGIYIEKKLRPFLEREVLGD